MNCLIVRVQMLVPRLTFPNREVKTKKIQNSGDILSNDGGIQFV